MGSHEEFRRIAAVAAQGALWPEVDQVYPLARWRQAFERLKAGEQFGKVVIEVAP
jgi:NADPH:quinone reductase-like Zn-dependent oxidoreductase